MIGPVFFFFPFSFSEEQTRVVKPLSHGTFIFCEIACLYGGAERNEGLRRNGWESRRYGLSLSRAIVINFLRRFLSARESFRFFFYIYEASMRLELQMCICIYTHTHTHTLLIAICIQIVERRPSILKDREISVFRILTNGIVQLLFCIIIGNEGTPPAAMCRNWHDT